MLTAAAGFREPAAGLTVRRSQQRWTLRRQLDDELAEERIGPGEPGTSKAECVVFPERFMHEAGAGGGIAQPVQALANLAIVGCSEGAIRDGHGPNGVDALVRAADALGGLAAAEVGIAVAERKFAGALVQRVVCGAGFEVAKSHETRGVGV